MPVLMCTYRDVQLLGTAPFHTLRTWAADMGIQVSMHTHQDTTRRRWSHGNEHASPCHWHVCRIFSRVHSPAYGLRSYLYILFHAAPIRMMQAIGIEQAYTKIGLFYGLRMLLACVSSYCEARLIHAVRQRFG